MVVCIASVPPTPPLSALICSTVRPPSHKPLHRATARVAACDAPVRRAVGWVYQNAKSFGGDPNRLYLSSHSSGSHIGGCVVTVEITVTRTPLRCTASTSERKSPSPENSTM